METRGSRARFVELIKHAIRDCELTDAEHDEIMDLAHEDGVVDRSEQNLLNQLQELIENGTVKRVPGRPAQ